MLRLVLVAALAVFSITPASAAWHKASSRHFVVYADADSAFLGTYAEKLERVDQAIRSARGMPDPDIGLGNRLHIFVVPSALDVAKLMRGNNPSVAGFYRTSATNMIAVVPRRTNRQSQLTPDAVFFHEYAHHLMFQAMNAPMPAWLVEGFAEFMSTAETLPNGSIGLGAAPVHRARDLYRRENPFPFTQLLAAAQPRTDRERSAVYSRGWLLTHYLTFSEKRRGQLDKYLSLMAGGMDGLQAAQSAFGDLRTLERDTEDYLKADKFPYLTVPPERLKLGTIKVEQLPAGAAAMMPLHIRLRAGADENRPALISEIAAVAARYPKDALVQTTLGNAYIDGGNPSGAGIAADAALAADPGSVEGMILKGRALLAQAKMSRKAEEFTAARSWFNKANRVDPEDPEPLIWFYRSFLEQKAPPTANAIAALTYASDLAPQDMALRLIAARLYLTQRKIAEAKRRLVPVAFNPHGGKLADEAQELLQRIGAASGQN